MANTVLPVKMRHIAEFVQAEDATLVSVHLSPRCLEGRLSDAQGVANRDIKLENVLIDSSPRPLIKICDFGYSKVKT